MLWQVLAGAALALAGQVKEVPLPARVPIDLGPDAPTQASPPPQIDILAPPPADGPATAAMIKECEDQREAGIVAGEIVVCRELAVPSAPYFSGSREAWLRDYAERSPGAGTPDVAGPGIFRGPATFAGMCFIPPCPKDPALIVDVQAIPRPPTGSDAERVAQGLVPVEAEMAPMTAEERKAKQAELGLPEAKNR